MHTVDIHEAETKLSRLLEEAVNGEPFIIAKAGKPLVTVVRIDETQAGQTRLGLGSGRFNVPEDFDRLNEEEIRRMFEGEPE
jgi:prevent-host-death family protein